MFNRKTLCLAALAIALALPSLPHVAHAADTPPTANVDAKKAAMHADHDADMKKRFADMKVRMDQKAKERAAKHRAHKPLTKQ